MLGHGCGDAGPGLKAHMLGDLWPPVGDNPEHFAIAGGSAEIDAASVPMIVKVATLHRVFGKVGVKQPGALPAFAAYARIDDAV